MTRFHGRPPKGVRPLFEAAEKAGWRIKLKGGANHWVLMAPDGVTIITYGGTVNDKGRKRQNLRSDLRRAGLDV